MTYEKGERVRLSALRDDWHSYLLLNPTDRPIDISDSWFDLCMQALHSHLCRIPNLTHLTVASLDNWNEANSPRCNERRPPETFGFDEWDLASIYELVPRFVTIKLIKDSQAAYIEKNARDDHHVLHLARRQAAQFLSSLMWSTDAGKETKNLRERWIKMNVYYARLADEEAYVSADGRAPDPTDDYATADRRARIFTMIAGWPPRRIEDGKTYSARTLDRGADRLLERVRRFMEYDILDMLSRVLWHHGFPSLTDDVDVTLASGGSPAEADADTGYSPVAGWKGLGAQDRALVETLARRIYAAWEGSERATWARRYDEADDGSMTVGGKTIGRAAFNTRIRKMAEAVAAECAAADMTTDDLQEFTRQVWLALDLLAGEDD